MNVIGGRVIWEADLVGDTFDLTELVQATKDKDPSVIKTADGFGLRYSEFEFKNQRRGWSRCFPECAKYS